MSILSAVLTAILTGSGAPALVTAAGVAIALITLAVAVLITAAKGRTTVDVTIGQRRDPP